MSETHRSLNKYIKKHLKSI